MLFFFFFLLQTPNLAKVKGKGIEMAMQIRPIPRGGEGGVVSRGQGCLNGRLPASLAVTQKLSCKHTADVLAVDKGAH